MACHRMAGGELKPSIMKVITITGNVPGKVIFNIEGLTQLQIMTLYNALEDASYSARTANSVRAELLKQLQEAIAPYL